NSSVIVGEKLVLKLLRQVHEGVHPELEMTTHLADQGFAHVVPVLGQLSRIDDQGQPSVLMIAQRYLSNQGDAWNWTQNTLDRALRDHLQGAEVTAEAPFNPMQELESFSRKLGLRL